MRMEYIDRNGIQKPIEGEIAFRSLVENGEIVADTLLRYADGSPWFKASTLAAFSAASSPKPGPAPGPFFALARATGRSAASTADSVRAQG
jgi:hypothetical protein